MILLPRRAIATDRWDDCIRQAANGMPYGESWWLDAATDGNWNGLVLGDYEVVQPVHYVRRYGVVNVLANPPFTQQLGPFGKLTAESFLLLLDRLPKPLGGRNLALSHAVDPAWLTGAERVMHTNLILDLHQPYEVIQGNYSKTLRQIVRSREPAELEPVPTKDFLRLYETSLPPTAQLKSRHLRAAARLIEAAGSRGRGDCLGVRNATGEWIAVAFLPSDDRRVINLMAVSPNNGRREHGMPRLLDAVIRRHAGSRRALDFEGSNLPGVQRFFRRFGAVEQNYPVLR